MEQATKDEMYEYLYEVIGAYNINNRSVLYDTKDPKKPVKCLYFKEDASGQGCAVGRRIEDKEFCKKLDSLENQGGILVKNIVDKLPDNLKKFNPAFLSLIQSLHDHDGNWNETGLSDRGGTRKQELLDKINDGFFDIKINFRLN